MNPVRTRNDLITARPEAFAALDAVAQGVLVVDCNSGAPNIAHANPAFVRLTGFDVPALLDRPFHTLPVLVQAEGRTDAASLQLLLDAMRGAVAFSGEILIRDSKDQPLLTRVTVAPMPDAQGAAPQLIVSFEDLTRTRQLRDSLRASEARLDIAMEASELSMWDWNVARDEVYYNEQWRTSIGVDPQALLARTELSERLLLPTHDAAVLEKFEMHFNGVTPVFECEYQLTTQSGKRKWFLARAKVVRRDDSGRALRVVGVLRDISSRKQSQQDSLEVQQRWERAVRGTSDGLYDWNLLTGHVWYAARFRDIVGYADTDFPDTFSAFQNVLHADDRSLVLNKIRAHLENQVRLDMRCRIVRRTGGVIWCRLRGEAERDAAGRPLRLAGSVSDISGQIDAEEALSRSQDFYGTILDSLPLFISYADRDERVVYANRLFQDFFRVPLVSSRGRGISDVIGDKRYNAIAPYFREALQGRTVESQGRLRDQHGKMVDIEAIFLPHYDETGEVQGCFVAARDVTERRQLEAELRQSQKMEAVGRLTGGIAHDFNNLLSVIMGNMQLLARSLRESPRLLRQAETAMKAAMRGAELTRRLLAFARQQVLEPRVVDLNAMVAGMYELLRRSLTGDIEIRQMLDPDVWSSKVDPGQLENAVLNLIINARDAMPDGGVITITTRNVTLAAEHAIGAEAVQAGDYAVLEVADNGTGMSPETLKRVFEPFFTTKDVGKGSGLGLSMVYGFVRQSGGQVTLTSAPGKGTVVQLCFPRTLAQVEHAGAEVGAPTELPQGSETILVVEDNREVRSTVMDILGSLGYRALEAANGHQALEQFMQHPDIALVFSDVMLPGGLPGTSLAAKLRERRPGLKMLMTSAFSDSAIMHRGMLDGSIEVLTKPYRVEDLARRVRAILDEEETKRVPA